jgi:hypothetical protein
MTPCALTSLPFNVDLASFGDFDHTRRGILTAIPTLIVSVPT